MDQNDTTPTNVSEEALQDMTVTDTGEMEKVTETVNENEPKAPQSVMDVTPPPQDDVVATPAAVVEEPKDDTQEAAGDANAEAPVSQAPQEQVVLPTGADPISTSPMHDSKKTGKGLIVAIAVVLALVLASIAILVFLKANKTTKSTDSAKNATTQQTASTQEAAKTPVTASDVDAVVSDVDATLSTLDENKDFSADSLSDKTLGLQ